MANASGGEYGGFFARFLAFFCDQLIASAILYLLIALLVQAGVFSIGLIWLLMVVVPPVYFAAMQSSAGQATIGKGLLGLKVATVNGDRASFLRNLGREFAKIISAIPLMIGYLMALFTGRKQALHDMVASTVVLDAGPAKPLKGAMVVVLAIVANGAIVGFMLQDVYQKVMQQMGGDLMAEMQKQGGMPSGTTLPRSAPPVAPKVAATPTPAPQVAAVAPRPAPEAPKMTATPTPMTVAAVENKPAPVVAMRSAVAAPAAKPAAAEPPATEAPAALPAGMPARVAAAAAPVPAPAPASSSAPASPAATPLPPLAAERPGVPGPKYNDLMSAALNKDVQGVNELLAFGKWPDKPDSHGVTPLMIAVRYGDAATAEALLKAGADPNRNAVGGESAMKIASAQRNDAMKALLERYATK